jgi:autotransporter translocation and assembly factor TamB
MPSDDGKRIEMTPSDNIDSTASEPSAGTPPKARSHWIFRVPLFIFFGIVLLLGLALVALQLKPIQDRLLAVVEKTVSRQLGATLSIDGFEGNFISNLAVEGISMSSPDGVPILFAKRISAEYSLTGIFFRTLNFRDISIDGLRLDLTKNAAGEWNLPSGSGLPTEPAPEDDASAPFRVRIARFLITDTRINMQANDTISSLSPLLDISRFSASLDTGDTITVSIEDSDMSFHRPSTFPLAITGLISLETDTAMVEFDHFLVNSGASRIIMDGSYRQDEHIPVFSVSLDADRVDLAEISDRLSLSSLPRSVVTGGLTVSGTLESFQSDIHLSMDDAAVDINGAAGLDDSRGLWTDLSAAIRDLDLLKTGVATSDLLSGVLSADLSLNGKHLLTPGSIEGGATAALKGLTISGIPLSVDLDADATGGALSINILDAASGQNRLEVSGTVDPASHALDLDIALGLPGPSPGAESLFASLPQLGVVPDGDIRLTAALTGWFDHPVFQFHVDSSGVAVRQHQADTVAVSGIWEGMPGPDCHLNDLDIAVKGLRSNFLEADSLVLGGNWQGWIETPSADLSLAARGLSANGVHVSALNFSGDLTGHPDAPDARADIVLDADGIKYDQMEAGALKLRAGGQGPISGFSARATLEVGQASLHGERFNGIFLVGNIDPGAAVFNLSGDHQGGSRFEVSGNVASWSAAPRHITIETVAVNTTAPWPAYALSNDTPLRLSLAENGLDIDSCSLHINDARISLSGGISTEGPLSLDIDLEEFDLSEIPGAWRENMGLSGSLLLTSTVDGDQERPHLSMQIGVKNLACQDVSHPADLSASIDYADNSLSIRTALEHQGNQTLLATGEIPLQFSLKPFSLALLPKNITAALKTESLKLSDLPIPPVADIQWDALADIDLQFTGTTDAPDLSGSLSIRDGSITLVKNRLTYESVTAGISFSDDRLVIDRLQVSGDREGRLSAGGTVFIKKNLPVIADLTLTGENFYIPYEKAISARISPDLHLTGGMAAPRLSGEVTISESRINLDKLSQAPKSGIQVIETDPSDYDPAALDDTVSEAPGFFSALSADIAVIVPRNAWLKGQDVNAEIAGDIAIRKKAGGLFYSQAPSPSSGATTTLWVKISSLPKATWNSWASRISIPI